MGFWRGWRAKRRCKKAGKHRPVDHGFAVQACAWCGRW